MGGNAFKGATRRYQREEYLKLEAEVVTKLNLLFYHSVMAKALVAYKQKESFGDMDVVIISERLPYTWQEDIIKAFDVTESQENGNVFSFVYKEFQIDLILTPEKYYYSTLGYFAYNDLGNLLGRMTHKMGLKLGHRGISLIVREDENNEPLKEIELDNSIYPALHILELDKLQYHEGFDTLEDIFKFVASSPYFNPDIYLLDNRNHASKIRDRKRKTYSAFLDWCEEHKHTLTHFDWGTTTEKGGYNIREPWFTDVICYMYPEAKEAVKEVIAQHELDKKFKTKFNGEIVMEITGLTNKELGMFMRYARERLLTIFSKEHIINTGDREVRRMIEGMLQFYDNGWDWPFIPAEVAEKLYGKVRDNPLL